MPSWVRLFHASVSAGPATRHFVDQLARDRSQTLHGIVLSACSSRLKLVRRQADGRYRSLRKKVMLRGLRRRLPYPSAGT